MAASAPLDEQVRMRATADTFIRFGFTSLLKMAFPEKYILAGFNIDVPDRAALLAYIAHASGFEVLGADMNYPPDPEQQQRHAAFCVKHELAPVDEFMVFHGTDAGASKSICEGCFDPARARTFMYGKGSAYVANSIDSALPYATPDAEGRVYRLSRRSRAQPERPRRPRARQRLTVIGARRALARPRAPECSVALGRAARSARHLQLPHARERGHRCRRP
jgi:hypothetical protein